MPLSGSSSTACRCAPTSRRGRSSRCRPRKESVRETETEVPETMPAVEEAFEEIEVDAPLVGIIMGSANDKEKMQPAGNALQDAGIRFEVRVMSAHRDPELVREYCTNARM